MGEASALCVGAQRPMGYRVSNYHIFCYLGVDELFDDVRVGHKGAMIYSICLGSGDCAIRRVVKRSALVLGFLSHGIMRLRVGSCVSFRKAGCGIQRGRGIAGERASLN